MFRIIVFFTSVLFFSFPVISSAREEVENKKYPPYPLIWAHDLSTIGQYVDVGDAYKMDDGDILFVLPIYDKKENLETGAMQKCTLLKFFSGEKTEADINECFKKMNNRSLGKKIELPVRLIHFNDGSNLKFVVEADERCVMLSTRLIPLQDDTFLTYAPRPRAILRFDKSMLLSLFPNCFREINAK